MKYLHCLTVLALIFFLSGCNTTGTSGSTGNEQNIGMAAGAVLGGLAGSQLGDGGAENVVAGALVGGLVGNLTGKEIAKRREALAAKEVQRQQAYHREMQRQREIEAELLRLEKEKAEAAALAAQAETEAEEALAEQKVEASSKAIVTQQKQKVETSDKISELDEEGKRIAKAMAELDELEADS